MAASFDYLALFDSTETKPCFAPTGKRSAKDVIADSHAKHCIPPDFTCRRTQKCPPGEQDKFLLRVAEAHSSGDQKALTFAITNLLVSKLCVAHRKSNLHNGNIPATWAWWPEHLSGLVLRVSPVMPSIGHKRKRIDGMDGNKDAYRNDGRRMLMSPQHLTPTKAVSMGFDNTPVTTLQDSEQSNQSVNPELFDFSSSPWTQEQYDAFEAEIGAYTAQGCHANPEPHFQDSALMYSDNADYLATTDRNSMYTTSSDHIDSRWNGADSAVAPAGPNPVESSSMSPNPTNYTDWSQNFPTESAHIVEEVKDAPHAYPSAPAQELSAVATPIDDALYTTPGIQKSPARPTASSASSPPQVPTKNTPAEDEPTDQQSMSCPSSSSLSFSLAATGILTSVFFPSLALSPIYRSSTCTSCYKHDDANPLCLKNSFPRGNHLLKDINAYVYELQKKYSKMEGNLAGST